MSDAPQVSKDEQNWAMACHLSALVGFVIPFGNIVGPLVVWMMKRGEMPLVERHGKEALNFQITVYLAAIVCFLLSIVLIGLPLLAALVVAHIVLTIIATMKASEGVAYRYPFNLRLVA